MSSPALQDLQGEVESYFLTIESPQSSTILVLSAETISTVISDLWPSTTYLVSLHVSNGAHNTTKAIVNITTEDGGMLKCIRETIENVYPYFKVLLLYTYLYAYCQVQVNSIRSIYLRVCVSQEMLNTSCSEA